MAVWCNIRFHTMGRLIEREDVERCTAIWCLLALAFTCTGNSSIMGLSLGAGAGAVRNVVCLDIYSVVD